jgi:hypothetical protein
VLSPNKNLEIKRLHNNQKTEKNSHDKNTPFQVKHAIIHSIDDLSNDVRPTRATVHAVYV